MLVDISHCSLEIVEYLGAETHHPGVALLVGLGAESDHELAQVVGGVENLHCHADRGLAVVGKHDVAVCDVLQVEADYLVGRVHLAVLEIAPHGIKQGEPLREKLLGPLAPGGALINRAVHDRPAEIHGSLLFLLRH